MSELAGQPGITAPDEAQPVGVRRSWLGSVLYSTFGRAGARFGAAWILLITLLAVFGPLIASSHPILMKMDGKWSSPMLRYLGGADIALLLATLVGAVLIFCRRYSIAGRIMFFLGSLVLVIPASFLLSQRPDNIWPGQYQVWEREGRIEWSLHAPVRHSPTELLVTDSANPHPQAPSAKHLLGTDRNAKDILSMMVHASRIALFVGFIATGISLVIGVVIGALMGYFAGWVDLLGMRLIEIFSAIPQLYLLLTFVAFFDRNIYMIMVIIGLTSWPGDARFVRAEFLRLRGQDFVHAARAAGLPLRSILFRHLLPNALAPLLVSASFGVASAILAEAVLSFLGLGLVTEPSWGQLLNQAVSAGGGFYWWLATFPGVAIFLTVFAYNLIGESLRDALDPRMKK